MCKKKTLFLFLFISTIIDCADIGSDTAVTRFNNQVLVNDGDRIAGFAGLNAGFQLFDSVTTALWDSFFTIAGDVELSAGQLNLNQDFILNETGRIASLGNIAGNNHQLHLAGVSNQDIPSGSLTECNISFLTEVIFGNRNVVACDWSVNDQYLVAGLQPNSLPEVQVYEFVDQNSLVFRDSFDVGNERVGATSWHPTQLWLATGNNSGTPELRIFTFDGSSLTEIQNVNFNGEVRGVKYHPTGNYLAVTTTDNAQEVLVYPVNGDGTLNTGGVVIFNVAANNDPDVHSLDWDESGSYLAVGFANGTITLQIYEVTFGPLAIVLNTSLNIGPVAGVSWNNRYTNLLATTGNTSPQFRIYEHDAAAPSLTLLTSIAPGANGEDVAWNKVNGECLALALLSNGGTELRTYFWNNELQTVTEIDGFEKTGQNTRQVVWSRAGDFLAVGSNDDSLEIYKVDAAFEEFIFSNLRLFLNGNVIMGDCGITFTGNNLLNGRDNCLTLMPTCTLKIDAQASILIQNIRIEGLKDQSIQLLDSTSTVSFKNCTFVMDEDITFNEGRFDVVQGFNLEGKDCNFVYTSAQKSRILQQGKLVVDTDTTFSYYPAVSSSSLLEMTHATSILRLQSGTLATSSAGLRLTKGIVQVDGKSFLSNDGTIQSEGIFFGDGVSIAQNICLEIEPAANLEILSGFFTHDNI